MRRVGRQTVGDAPRKLIAIRLDAKVLGRLRKTAEKKGLPYQSFVNEILAGEMRKAS
jgi:predicted DNA binding CopG/RHH family protein